MRSPTRALAPFWVMPLTLGVLALPRKIELAGFEQIVAGDGASR